MVEKRVVFPDAAVNVPGSVRATVTSTRITPGLPQYRPAVSPGYACVCSIPEESVDARITGTTRSLQRRLLALNLGGSLAGNGDV